MQLIPFKKNCGDTFMDLENSQKFYAENGYLVVDNLFDAGQLMRANSAITEILASGPLDTIAELEPNDRNTIRRIWSPIKKHKQFKAMAENAALLDIVAALIGDNFQLHYTKLNMKGPRVGSVVEWHQDFAYYPHTNFDLLSCLVYLDDATVDNGCLEVIPGSHQWGLLNHEVDGAFRGKLATDKVAEFQGQAKSLTAKAGSVVFLHCMTLHYSNINTSNKPRRAFLPAYRAADAFPIYYGEHAAHNEADAYIVRGEKSKAARVVAGVWPLPVAEKKFHSLYELQEGSHLSKVSGEKAGYYSV
jgi:phytanoyl-CoA hydroxylase